MPGSMSHWTAAQRSSQGYGESGFVEGQGTKLPKENCKNMSDGGRQLCMKRNLDNGHGYVQGGSNKKRKTKMQKKRKNRRTKKSSKR